MIRTAGGAFDPNDPWCYFLAANPDRQQWGARAHQHILIAVNELKSPAQLAQVETWVSAGLRVFLDSGIFNLTNAHARAHECSMDEALALAPDDIDGFDELWNRYLSTVQQVGDRAWGYIELDQGGRENKIKTRAKLEERGLRPVPVYHPLNDGWDYFDYLAERYDRICIGNIVQADEHTRRRLVATAWERHRRYPHLWIHVLGYTPDERLNAWPMNSADSSTWLAAVRWDGVHERVDGRAFSTLEKNYQYVLGSEPDGETGSQKACMLSAYAARHHERNWRNHLAAWKRLGCDLYPPMREGAPQ